MFVSKFGEEYYYLILDETTDKAMVKVKKKKWKNDNFDITMSFLDNVYESKAEAEEDKGRYLLTKEQVQRRKVNER